MFRPLKQHWSEACHIFLQKYPGVVISKLNFSRVFSAAWMKALTPENITAGFRKCGVYPFNRHAISLPHEESGSTPSAPQLQLVSQAFHPHPQPSLHLFSIPSHPVVTLEPLQLAWPFLWLLVVFWIVQQVPVQHLRTSKFHCLRGGLRKDMTFTVTNIMLPGLTYIIRSQLQCVM